jgi:hypothetical protein
VTQDLSSTNTSRYARSFESGLAIYQNPWVKTIVTSSFLAAAFVAGYVSRLGWGFSPLVNRIDMIGSVVLTASLFGVLVRIVWVGLQAFFEKEEPKESQIVQSSLRYVKAVATFVRRYFKFLAAVNIVVSVSLISLFIYNDYPVGSIVIPIFIMGSHLLIAMAAKRRWRVFAGVLRYFGLAFVFCLGSAWVDIPRLLPGQLTIEIGEPRTSHDAAIILRAVEGVLLFLDDETVVTFLPWDEIKSIKSKKDGGLREAARFGQ